MYSIMIVDDEQRVLNTLSRYIEREEQDFHVIGSFLDGESALEAMEIDQPDILISDIQMIGMSGLELVEEVHKRYPDLIVFMLSAYRNFEYARTAMKHGAEYYLLKPIDFGELSEALRKAADQIAKERKRFPQTENAAVNYEEVPDDELGTAYADNLPPLPVKPEKESGNGKLVNRAVDYIEAHYREDISRDDIAKGVWTSSSYLSRIFKQVMGIGLMEYLLRYRVLQAIELLKQNVKVADIGAAVGYQDYNTFLWHFKRCTQMSPNEYRRVVLRLRD